MFRFSTVYLFRMIQARKFLWLSIFLSFGTILVVLIIPHRPINDLNRKYRLAKIEQLIRSKASNLACKQPNLPVYAPEIAKFLHEVPPIDCSAAGMDWVKCQGSHCVIQEQVKLMYGPIKCAFTNILRVNDFEVFDGHTEYSDSHYELAATNVVRASCKSQSNKWSATLIGVRPPPPSRPKGHWSNIREKGLRLNVLMFGFDSLSRNAFIRKLPKSYEYLTKELHADVLLGYNIVGDGTPQALIPILTGNTELELPDTRKRVPNTAFVDSYPFIWDDFKKSGYSTAFLEDVPELGTFTYRLNGFNEKPTDFYMRTYYIASLKERSKWPKLCAGEIPRHKVMLNHIKDFYAFRKEVPKFLFAFHGELSHDDYNLIGAADNDVYEFLKDLKHSGALNDTILIMMADHGHRFADIRNTIQGKQEERLPFFSFTFPQSFKTEHKTAYSNFRSNLDKLTTPFDIHETLKAVLNLKNVGPADISKRSVSLFTKIPAERSCAHAYIEPHWCACLDWHNIPLSSPIVNRIAETLVATINHYTEPHRNLCETLKVSEIEWVTKLTPNENLIKFNKNADLDGFVADLSAKMDIKSDTYQIKVVMVPGDSIFEASVTYYSDEDRVEVRMTDISRINKYGRQARCVENEFPHLRKYCYCRDD